MTEREKLLRDVQMYDLALVDAGLYLDGHSKNVDALTYYKKQQELYQNAVRAYEEKYGPLMSKTAQIKNQWMWTEEPWPWEGAEH